MRQTTLCLALRNDGVLLAMKKFGFGVGKWNGAGGKVKNGETIPEAAARETREEVGLEVNPADLEKVGEIKFYFDENPEFNQQMHVFLAREWRGEPTESDEMKPQWFSFSDIPYSSMWVDDQFWLPKVLSGKKVEASFYFSGKGETLIKQEIREI